MAVRSTYCVHIVQTGVNQEYKLLNDTFDLHAPESDSNFQFEEQTL